MTSPTEFKITLVGNAHDAQTQAMQGAVPGSKPIGSLLEVREVLSRYPRRSIVRLDFVGHGEAGRICMGLRGDPDTMLQNSHRSYSRLYPLAEKLHPSAEIRLLGCAVGLRDPRRPWHDGLTLSFALSSMLGVPVTVSMVALRYDNFATDGDLRAMQEDDFRTVDARKGHVYDPEEPSADRLFRDLEKTRPKLRNIKRPVESADATDWPMLAKDQRDAIVKAFDFEDGRDAGDLGVLDAARFTFDSEQGLEKGRLVFGGQGLMIGHGQDRTVHPRRAYTDDRTARLIEQILDAGRNAAEDS